RDGIPPRGGDECKRDTSVAAGRLDQLISFFENTSFFGVPDHRGSDPALHGISGIATFYLGQHRNRRSSGYAAQPDERRPADTERIIGVEHSFSQLDGFPKYPSLARSDYAFRSKRE